MKSWMLDLSMLVAAFVGASLIALATGASLGHAFTFGQLAFAASLAYVLLRR